jgi:P27 family predicted phage terminase small subunit
LSKGAILEWERVYPELERMGLLTVVDQHSFGAYCTAVDQLAHAMRLLKPTKANPTPAILVSTNGKETASGAELMRRQVTEEIRKFSAMFGFSPADRARIVAAPTKPVDDLNAVLSGNATN